MGKRVAVVGAGVIGLCAAAEVAERGHEVVVYDRQSEDAERCSTGNAGMVVPSHVIPLAAPGMVGLGLRMMLNPKGPFRIRPRMDLAQLRWMWQFMRSANQKNVEAGGPALRDLSLLSRKRYLELADADDFGLVKRGLLMVCSKTETLQEERHTVDFARKLGLSAEMLTPEDLAKLDPGVHYVSAGAAYFPDDCHLNPSQFLGSLRRRIRAAGGTFRYGEQPRDLKSIEADEVVLAAGVWTRDLAHQAGVNLPLVSGKGYSMTLGQPPVLPQVCSILVEGRVAVTPMGNSLRVGGTMEIGGEEGTIDRRRVDGIADTFCSYVPACPRSAFDGLPVWHGLRPCSPDGLPYIGKVGRYTIAAGHAMMGLSLGPATGIVAAELIDGQTPTVSLSAFDPRRFS